MSAMDKMLGDMLKRAIPQEVLDLLTPEKIEELGNKISQYITSTGESLARIEAGLLSIETAQVKTKETLITILARLDELETGNDNRDSGSNGDTGRKRRGNSGSGGVTGNAND